MDKAMEFWYDKNNKEIENNKHLIMLDMDKQELKQLAKGDELVMKFTEKITILNENQQFRQLMSTEEDSKKLEKTFIENARKEGEETGRIEGKKETLKEIAQKLYQKGLSVKEISTMLDKAQEEITAIIKN